MAATSGECSEGRGRSRFRWSEEAPGLLPPPLLALSNFEAPFPVVKKERGETILQRGGGAAASRARQCPQSAQLPLTWTC